MVIQHNDRYCTILRRHSKGSLMALSSIVIGTSVNAALRSKESHKGVERSASTSDVSIDELNKQTKAEAARALHLMALLAS
jgi:hypothetical protein